jgi:hypothetical protein
MQLHENPSVILHRSRNINSKIHVDTSKTPNSKNDPDKKEQCWQYHNIALQSILHSHITKASMVLAQKQMHRQMDYSSRPRNKTHSYSHLNLGEGWQLGFEFTMARHGLYHLNHVPKPSQLIFDTGKENIR